MGLFTVWLCCILSNCAELSLSPLRTEPHGPEETVMAERTGSIGANPSMPPYGEIAPSPSEKPRACDHGGVAIGMSKLQVMRSCWGKPKSSSHSTIGRTRSELLFYEGYKYIYLENDVVKSIQGPGH